MYNKPEGEVTTREDPEGRPTIFEALPALKGARWIAIGRLDINTTGLLLLSTDGELANALMHPSFEVEREYVCRVRAPEGQDKVPDNLVDRLARGVALDDGPAKFDEIERIGGSDSHDWFRVLLKEGRNREVRRLWESQGCQVSRLKRIRYGKVELPRELLRGQSQEMASDKVEKLRTELGLEDGTPSALTLQPVIGQRKAAKSTINLAGEGRRRARRRPEPRRRRPRTAPLRPRPRGPWRPLRQQEAARRPDRQRRSRGQAVAQAVQAAPGQGPARVARRQSGRVPHLVRARRRRHRPQRPSQRRWPGAAQAVWQQARWRPRPAAPAARVAAVATRAGSERGPGGGQGERGRAVPVAAVAAMASAVRARPVAATAASAAVAVTRASVAVPVAAAKARASAARVRTGIRAMRPASRPTTPTPAASIRTATSRAARVAHAPVVRVRAASPAAARVPVARAARAPAARVRVARAAADAPVADAVRAAGPDRPRFQLKKQRALRRPLFLCAVVNDASRIIRERCSSPVHRSLRALASLERRSCRHTPRRRRFPAGTCPCHATCRWHRRDRPCRCSP